MNLFHLFLNLFATLFFFLRMKNKLWTKLTCDLKTESHFFIYISTNNSWVSILYKYLENWLVLWMMFYTCNNHTHKIIRRRNKDTLSPQSIFTFFPRCLSLLPPSVRRDVKELWELSLLFVFLIVLHFLYWVGSSISRDLKTKYPPRVGFVKGVCLSIPLALQ